MLTSYIQAGMDLAEYERLEDGTYYGEISACPGVWADGKTLEECRRSLQEVLEEWIILKLRDRDDMPVIGGIDLLAVTA